MLSDVLGDSFSLICCRVSLVLRGHSEVLRDGHKDVAGASNRHAPEASICASDLNVPIGAKYHSADMDQLRVWRCLSWLNRFRSYRASPSRDARTGAEAEMPVEC